MAAKVAVASVYYIDPVGGDNANNGGNSSPWKSFAPLNMVTLKPGDRVEVIRAGELCDTLSPVGAGNEQSPVVIHFAAGRYDWFPGKLLTRKLMISNTNDDPRGDKALAMELRGLKWFRIEGDGAVFFCRGKMMQVHLEQSRNITLAGFGFDYQRPTVSEYTVESLDANSAALVIHPDSTYRLVDGKVLWVGEGWQVDSGGYGQIFRPEHKTVWRAGSPLADVDHAEEISPGRLRVYFNKNPRFTAGLVYQHRDTRRDYSSVFCDRSENINWLNVKFHFTHGMGVVSQFSRNLTFRDIDYTPRAESGRTCAAWADMLHFSGCAGKILVENVRFFGANDDAINIHGTHLRIVKTIAPNQLKVRFMHGQTYGFPAFTDGDEVDFINGKTLRPYATATVSGAAMDGDRGMTLTLKGPLPANIQPDDVLENVTWTPAVEIRHCVVEAVPTRGFLLATRRPVVVADNVFRRTRMSAILVADDAASWFESGMVKDFAISGNTFDHCGWPVLNFHPENREANEEEAVHTNIKIINNKFLLNDRRVLSLKSTDNVTLADNQFILDKKEPRPTVEQLIERKASPPVKVSGNTVK
jgi:hypothetical protein